MEESDHIGFIAMIDVITLMLGLLPGFCQIYMLMKFDYEHSTIANCWIEILSMI